MQEEEVEMEVAQKEQQDLHHAIVHSLSDKTNNRLLCLRLQNCSSWLAQQLLKSHHLAECAARFENSMQMQPPWSNGVLLLVPVSEREVQEAQWTLRPHHIVSLEEDVPRIRHALADIPKRQGRPKVDVERGFSTSATAGSSRPESEEVSTSCDENEEVLVVENTFYTMRSVSSSSCRRSKSA